MKAALAEIVSGLRQDATEAIFLFVGKLLHDSSF
jgi:hypothetical protein